MKRIIARLVSVKNLIGLLLIIFNFCYAGINFYLNKGNYYLSIALLFSTFIYLLLYIYSVYIENNKRMKKQVKKVYKHSKKFIGFINACIIITSIFTSEIHSTFSIIMAIITIMLYFMYLLIEICTHKIKTKFNEVKGIFKRNKEKEDYYDNRDNR